VSGVGVREGSNVDHGVERREGRRSASIDDNTVASDGSSNANRVLL
jgi:hypothetical protein